MSDVADAQSEARLEILVAMEVALALHQPEATRAVVDEGADLQVGRIAQRPPQLLAAPVLNRESVGIVQLGPPVGVEAGNEPPQAARENQRRRNPAVVKKISCYYFPAEENCRRSDTPDRKYVGLTTW